MARYVVKLEDLGLDESLSVDELYGIDDVKCAARCPHGGECTLEMGHIGAHDAGFNCKWHDEYVQYTTESEPSDSLYVGWSLI